MLSYPRLSCPTQEAGVAICDSLLDYYLPNQAQREQAYRDLLARDGVEVDVEVESIGLSPRNPASVKSSSFDTVDGSEGRLEGGGGGGEVDITVHDSKDRDDDDEVTEANTLPLNFAARCFADISSVRNHILVSMYFLRTTIRYAFTSQPL